MDGYVSQPLPTTQWPHIAATTATDSVEEVQGDARLMEDGLEIHLLAGMEVYRPHAH